MPITVVPGQKVGKVYLGARRESVINFIGQPQFTNTSDVTGLTRDVYVGSQPPNDLERTLTIIYSPSIDDEANSIKEEARVIQIEFNSPAFVTSDGISTKSSTEQFLARYPNAARSLYERPSEEPDFQQTDLYFDDTQAGIAYQVVTTGQYEHDLIFIRIHLPRLAVLHDGVGELGFPDSSLFKP